MRKVFQWSLVAVSVMLMACGGSKGEAYDDPSTENKTQVTEQEQTESDALDNNEQLTQVSDSSEQNTQGSTNAEWYFISERNNQTEKVVTNKIHNNIYKKVTRQNDFADLVYSELSTAEFLSKYFMRSLQTSSSQFMISDPQSFVIPENTISFSLNFSNSLAGTDLFIAELETPTGKKVPLSQLIPCFNGTCSMVIPNRSGELFQAIPGEWKYRVLVEKTAYERKLIAQAEVDLLVRVSDGAYEPEPYYEFKSPKERGIACEYVEGAETEDLVADGNCKLINPIANYYSELIANSANISAVLPIQAYYTGNKTSHDHVTNVMNRLVEVFLINGIGVEWQAPINISRQHFARVSADFSDPETQTLMAHGDDNVINVYFIENFESFGGNPPKVHPGMHHELEFILGIAAGIPGSLGTEGAANGVLVSFGSVNGVPRFSAQFSAEVAAHEIGHFLGLFHTTEFSGRADVLSDTPVCPLDNDNETIGDASTCPDGYNLMFPAARDDDESGIWLTPDQRQILMRSPLSK